MATRPALPAALRLAVLNRDGWKCRYCHDQEGPFHLDHVVPWSKGGPDSLDNLVTACVPCNLAKRTTEWTVPDVAEIGLTPRRELIRQAMTRRLTLERIAADRGHTATWRACSKRTIFWRCTCGTTGKAPKVSGLSPKIRWHLMDAIGVTLD